MSGGRRCTVCDHKDRKAIDSALHLESERIVSERFGLSKSSIHRHRTNCMGPAIARVAASREDTSAASILDRMASLQTRTLRLLDAAEAQGAKPVEAVRIVREVRENELALARLTGLLREGSTTIHAQSMQIASFDALSVEELRALAQLGTPKALSARIVSSEVVIDAEIIPNKTDRIAAIVSAEAQDARK